MSPGTPHDRGEGRRPHRHGRIGRLVEALIGRSQFARVAKDTGQVFAIQSIGIALAYAAQIALARWMGVAEYGSMAYVVSWATLLTTLALLGFPTTIQRFLAEYRTDGHWGAAKGLARGTMAASLVTGLLVAATAALFALLVLPAEWNGIARDVLVLGVFLVPLLALSMLGTELARGEERFTVAYLPTRVGRHLLLILGVGGVAVWRSPTARDAILVLGTVLAVVFVVQRLALGRHRPAGYRAATARFAWGSWLEVSLPLLGIAVTSVALNQSGLLLIGSMLGAEEAGIYGAAWRTATLVSFLLEATNAVVAPSIAALYYQERRDELQALLSAVVGWIFWPTLAVCVALALASGFVLGLFGADFVPRGRAVLVILVVGHLVNAATGPVAYVMNLTGGQRTTARVYLAGAVVTVGLNLILIPAFGLVGGALATTAGMIFWNVVLAVLVVRRRGLRTSILHALLARRAA